MEKRKILIVDDDAQYCRVNRTVFNKRMFSM